MTVQQAVEITQNLIGLDEAKLFRERVSEAVPNYYSIIQYPMYLSKALRIIKGDEKPEFLVTLDLDDQKAINEGIVKSKNKGLVPALLVQESINLIWSNCAKYNGQKAPITQLANRLKRGFMKNLRKSVESGNESNFAATFSPQKSGEKIFLKLRKPEKMDEETPTESRSENEFKQSTFNNWKEAARWILDRLNNYSVANIRIDSKDFCFKIDPERDQLLKYTEIVKKQMDLGTVKQNLETGAYSSLDAFAEDTKLVFKNAIRYWKKMGQRDNQVSINSHLFKNELKLLLRISEERLRRIKNPKVDIPSPYLVQQALKTVDYCIAWFPGFKDPVIPSNWGMRNYFGIVKTPMDLSTLRRRLCAHLYDGDTNGKSFLEDAKLIWENCRTYWNENHRKYWPPSSDDIAKDVLISAKELERKFLDDFQKSQRSNRKLQSKHLQPSINDFIATQDTTRAQLSDETRSEKVRDIDVMPASPNTNKKKKKKKKKRKEPTTPASQRNIPRKTPKIRENPIATNEITHNSTPTRRQNSTPNHLTPKHGPSSHSVRSPYQAKPSGKNILRIVARTSPKAAIDNSSSSNRPTALTSERPTANLSFPLTNPPYELCNRRQEKSKRRRVSLPSSDRKSFLRHCQTLNNTPPVPSANRLLGLSCRPDIRSKMALENSNFTMSTDKIQNRQAISHRYTCNKPRATSHTDQKMNRKGKGLFWKKVAKRRKNFLNPDFDSTEIEETNYCTSPKWVAERENDHSSIPLKSLGRRESLLSPLEIPWIPHCVRSVCCQLRNLGFSEIGRAPNQCERKRILSSILMLINAEDYKDCVEYSMVREPVTVLLPKTSEKEIDKILRIIEWKTTNKFQAKERKHLQGLLDCNLLSETLATKTRGLPYQKFYRKMKNLLEILSPLDSRSGLLRLQLEENTAFPCIWVRASKTIVCDILCNPAGSSLTLEHTTILLFGVGKTPETSSTCSLRILNLKSLSPSQYAFMQGIPPLLSGIKNAINCDSGGVQTFSNTLSRHGLEKLYLCLKNNGLDADDLTWSDSGYFYALHMQGPVPSNLEGKRECSSHDIRHLDAKCSLSDQWSNCLAVEDVTTGCTIPSLAVHLFYVPMRGNVSSFTLEGVEFVARGGMFFEKRALASQTIQAASLAHLKKQLTIKRLTLRDVA